MTRTAYRFTSIGRPLDLSVGTNRLVATLAPFAGVIHGTSAAVVGAGVVTTVVSALVASVATFGAWATARELAPDDNPAAFVSMGAAFAAIFFMGEPGLLLLFCALFLVRMVTRSVGPPARVTDSLGVLGLTVYAIYTLRSPGIGVAAAVAFGVDAALAPGRSRQFFFAAMCVGAAGWGVSRDGVIADGATALDPAVAGLLAAVTAIYLLSVVAMRPVESVADAAGVPLSSARVRAGMLIGWSLAALALSRGPVGAGEGGMLWATLAGVGLSGLRWWRPRR